jgi:hypothetical protein
MKKYITWKRKKVNENCYKDPNTDNRTNEETTWQATFTETTYKINDGRFISFVEYSDDCLEDDVETFRNLDPDFEFTFIDENTANTLLSELGDVTVSNFEFTDNRPNDI